MEEETTVNQVKSEKNELEDGEDKTNPNEKLVITKGGPKILSRYLNSPKGSCHDFCKYGIKHAVEAKTWSTAQKRRVIWKEKETKVPKETVTSLAGTKKSRSNAKPSPTPKIEEPNSPVDIKEVVISSSTNEETVTSEKKSPPFEETNASLEHTKSDDIRRANLEPSSLIVQESSNAEEIVKSKSPSGSCGKKKIESRSKQTRKSSIGGREKSVPPTSIPLSSKHNVKKVKPSSSSAKTTKILNQMKGEEVKPEQASNDDFPEKILHVIEPTSENSSVEPTLASGDTGKLSSASPSTSGDKSLKKTRKQIGKSGLSAASTRKGLRHVGHGNNAIMSPSGNKGKRHIQRKTPSASPLPSASSKSSPSSSLPKQNGGTFKFNRTAGHQGENVKAGYKIRPKRSTIVVETNKVIPARKLTFRRGRVLEIQPPNNNIPRRLKFRPARRLGDDCFQRDRKRIIKGKEVKEGELNDASITSGKKVGDGSMIDGSKSGSQKVVLRHQNVEGKKVNPRLYNNVIEETATMLAEQRKSKVKALVGAFETVISLDSPREATPSEVSTAC